MARKRPTASDVLPPASGTPGHAKLAAGAVLTRAEARALRRSAPLTPEQFKLLGRRAEQGISIPVRHD